MRDPDLGVFNRNMELCERFSVLCEHVCQLFLLTTQYQHEECRIAQGTSAAHTLNHNYLVSRCHTSRSRNEAQTAQERSGRADG